MKTFDYSTTEYDYFIFQAKLSQIFSKIREFCADNDIKNESEYNKLEIQNIEFSELVESFHDYVAELNNDIAESKVTFRISEKYDCIALVDAIFHKNFTGFHVTMSMKFYKVYAGNNPNTRDRNIANFFLPYQKNAIN